MKQFPFEMQVSLAVIVIMALALLALRDWPQLMDAVVVFVFGVPR
jgi:uncharacterized membrane protein YczE